MVGAAQNSTPATDRPGRSGPPRRRGRFTREEPDVMANFEPKSMLGHLVKGKKVQSFSRIHMDSLKIREWEAGMSLLGPEIKQVKSHQKSVQRQTRSGQTTKLKSIVCVGNNKNVIGVGVASARESPLSVTQATQDACRNLVPVKHGYYDVPTSNTQPMNTVPCKVTGKCGSVIVKLLPANSGRGIVANTTLKPLIEMAGIKDVYVKSNGHTATRENHVKACLDALSKTYEFYSKNEWQLKNNTRTLSDDAHILKNRSGVIA